MHRLSFGAAVAVAIVSCVVLGAQAPAALDAGTLFTIDRVWTINLSFAPQAWDTLAPTPTSPAAVRTGEGFIGPAGKRNGISAIRGIDFQYVHAGFDIDGRRFADVGVRYKGNGTYTSGSALGKVSLKVDFNKYVKGQKLAGISTINLHNNITDPSWMNEVLAYRLYRDAGVVAPRTAYARVFVTVQGRPKRYLGLYAVVENVDAAFVESRYHVAGGALFKPVTTRLFNDLGRDWSKYNQSYDPKTPLTDADRQRIFEMADLVTHASDDVFAAKVPQFVDLDAFARYAAVLVWLGNPDSLLQQGQNYYIHVHPRTHLMSFVPWDQDHSFGQFLWAPDSQQQDLDIMRPVGPSRFLARVFGVEAFRQRYRAAMREITRTLTTPERLAAQVDQLAAVIGPAVAEEPLAGRAELFRMAVAGRPFQRPFYGGTATPIKPFVRVRQASVLKQLQALGAP
jgi:hypothetical protein